MTLDNIGTGGYMKIISSAAKPKEIKKISLNRGTSVDVVLSEYVV